jgi:hypothetical protein
VRLYSDAPAICPDQQQNPRDQHYPTVDRPLRLPGHGAARKNVDSLENPRAPDQQTQDAEDVECDARCFMSCEKRLLRGVAHETFRVFRYCHRIPNAVRRRRIRTRIEDRNSRETNRVHSWRGGQSLITGGRLGGSWNAAAEEQCEQHVRERSTCCAPVLDS